MVNGHGDEVSKRCRLNGCVASRVSWSAPSQNLPEVI